MPKVSNARTLELCHEIPELAAFRVVPKANSPLTDELFPLTWSTLESPEARVAGVLRVIRSHPEDFWNDYVAADMHLRLFDLAYLYDLRGDSRGKELARVAEDVYHKRANSAFGQWFEELIANDIDSIIGTDEEGYAAA
jgi:hypothetical protein